MPLASRLTAAACYNGPGPARQTLAPGGGKETRSMLNITFQQIEAFLTVAERLNLTDTAG
jgi:hypothetical protein